MTTKTIFITSGSTWTVPSDWNSSNNSIHATAGGAGGGSSVAHNPTPGGGGAYSKAVNVALTPGAVVNINVGAGGVGGTTHTNPTATGGTGGDTWLSNSNTAAAITDSGVLVGAKGGIGGTDTSGAITPGVGGAASGGVGSTKNSGGNGGTNGSGGRGGGGGAAGPNGPGGNGGFDTNSGSWGGAGGGGAGGGGSGTAGANGNGNSGSAGGAGGNNAAGSGSGAGGASNASGTAGTVGGGGGGGGADAGGSPAGGAGGAGSDWTATAGGTAGPGGGGGQAGLATGTDNNVGGTGGLYGGGGGAGSALSSNPLTSGSGAQGILVAIYSTVTLSIALSPTSVTGGTMAVAGTTGNAITITGTGTAFTNGCFAISGGFGAFITAQSASSGTAGSVTLNSGLYGYGDITVTDTNSGATATLTVAKPALGNLKIGWIGASLTSGTNGNPVAQAATRLTAHGYTVTMVNEAVSGADSSQWVSGSSHLTTAMAAFASAGVTVVVVGADICGNDFRGPNNFTTAQHFTNITNVVNTLTGAGYTVILQEMTCITPNAIISGNQWANNINELFRSAFSLDAALINGTTVLLGDRAAHVYTEENLVTYLNADGVHPADATQNNIIGDFWAYGIMEALNTGLRFGYPPNAMMFGI